MNIKFNYYPGGKKKALTMSYDDGTIHDRRLVSIFNKHGIKGTFHLNAGHLDRENVLCSNEINELFRGHEVSAHSLTHPFITMLPTEALIDELREDRRRLEAIAGYPVRGMSYPFGDYNEAILQALPLLGIEYARTVRSHGGFGLPENFLEWHPTCHHETNLMGTMQEFRQTPGWLQMPLLYVWGHSYEFDRNNNWSLMEEFCAAAAFDKDTWYATNIEICDYIAALRSLKFDVDKTMVLNPSAISVWVDADGGAVEIKPGELKKI